LLSNSGGKFARVSAIFFTPDGPVRATGKRLSTDSCIHPEQRESDSELILRLESVAEEEPKHAPTPNADAARIKQLNRMNPLNPQEAARPYFQQNSLSHPKRTKK
jgi:hypothetical protein